LSCGQRQPNHGAIICINQFILPLLKHFASGLLDIFALGKLLQVVIADLVGNIIIE